MCTNTDACWLCVWYVLEGHLAVCDRMTILLPLTASVSEGSMLTDEALQVGQQSYQFGFVGFVGFVSGL
jgi:hypothetical protein